MSSEIPYGAAVTWQLGMELLKDSTGLDVEDDLLAWLAVNAGYFLGTLSRLSTNVPMRDLSTPWAFAQVVAFHDAGSRSC